MRFKSTLILLLVFAVLGGYVYFTEYRGREERQKLEESKKKVFPIEQKDITEISLEYPDRTFTAIKKGEKQWEITNPAGVQADPDEWDSLASNIARIEKDETVTTEKTDLAPYGLDKPLVKVTAKLQDGKSIGVLLGGENPKKTFIYAKTPDKDDVFLAGSSWSGVFKKTLTDLRDKKVLEFETDSIDAVKIAAAGAPLIEIQKSGTDWVLKKPVEAPADAGEMNSFLSSIQFARASDFADAALDAKTTGLDVPAVTVTLHDSKAGTDRVLAFGKPTAKDATQKDVKFYARDQGRPAVFILGTEVLEKAKRPAGDWRDKTVARFNRESIDELELVKGSDKMVLKKMGMDWQTADGRKLQADKIPTMLNVLEGARALQFIDPPKALSTYSLDKPRLTVTLRQGGKDTLGLGFGSESKMPEGVFLKITSSPALLIVSKDLLSQFDVKLSDLVEAAAEPPAPPK